MNPKLEQICNAVNDLVNVNGSVSEIRDKLFTLEPDLAIAEAAKEWAKNYLAIQLAIKSAVAMNVDWELLKPLQKAEDAIRAAVEKAKICHCL